MDWVEFGLGNTIPTVDTKVSCAIICQADHDFPAVVAVYFPNAVSKADAILEAVATAAVHVYAPARINGKGQACADSG